MLQVGRTFGLGLTTLKTNLDQFAAELYARMRIGVVKISAKRADR
jgi:hypothetical protein